MKLFFAILPMPDSYAAIGWICVALAAIAFGANQFAEFWRNVKDRPTGQEVMDKAREVFQPIGDYVTRSEWTARELALGQSLKTLSDENKLILKAGEERESHISTRIDGLQTTIGKQPGEFMAMLANALTVAHANSKK